MKTFALCCNVALACFTALVVVTDGMSAQAPYVALALAMLVVPVFTAFVLARVEARDRRVARRPESGGGAANVPAISAATTVESVATVANVVMLAAFAWAFVAQYPHPREDGFVAFVVLAVLTPAVSALALADVVRRARLRSR